MDTSQNGPGAGVGKGRGEGSRGTQFGVRPQPEREKLAEVVFDPASPLEDVRHVLSRPKKADSTPGQKAARKHLERDYPGFVRFLRKLEAEEQSALEAAEEKTKTEAREGDKEVAQPLSSPPSTHSAPPVLLDDGTEKAVRLFEKPIRQLTEGGRLTEH